MAIDVGDVAPDLDLKNPDGESVKLSSFRGNKPVLVVFYPFTFTGVCEGELCTLRDDFSTFTDAGVQILAVSCDSKNAQKVWTEQNGFPYPLLSDFWPHGEVAKAYGVFNDALGCANRATFLVGTDGKVVDTFASDNLGTARPAERYAEALAKL
jgi:peroxiredoxin